LAQSRHITKLRLAQAEFSAGPANQAADLLRRACKVDHGFRSDRIMRQIE
jgi:hypothetical protein